LRPLLPTFCFVAISKPLFQLIQPDRNSPWKLRTAEIGGEVYHPQAWCVPDRKVPKRAEGSKGDAMVVASGAVVVAVAQRSFCRLSPILFVTD
jgi:hypothetical protein